MSISENIAAIRQRIPQHVALMAVSKTVDSARLREALETGQRVFGENYVQEAAAKWPDLKARYPDSELHFIGHLQTNKAEEAVKLFDSIDTLDRPKLAHALAKAMAKINRRVPLLIEVNLGNEAQKAGCAANDLAALLHLACDELKLDVRGLMCIPPATVDPAPYFRQLTLLADIHGLAIRSMGMSADYESAIANGATMVRVGTSVFGKR